MDYSFSKKMQQVLLFWSLFFLSNGQGADLLPRVFFPGFSFQPPQGFAGPIIEQKGASTRIRFIEKTEKKKDEASIDFVVIDLQKSPDWIGYNQMLEGELFEHLVRQIAQKSIEFRSEPMHEVDFEDFQMRRIYWRCYVKNKAMQLIPLEGFTMAKRRGDFYVVIHVQENKKKKASLESSVTSFQWEPFDDFE